MVEHQQEQVTPIQIEENEQQQQQQQQSNIVQGQVPHQEPPSFDNNNQVNKLSSNLQGCNLSTVLDPAFFNETIQGIVDCKNLIPTCTSSSIKFLQALQTQFAMYSMERLSPTQQIQLVGILTELTTALEIKTAELFTAQQGSSLQQLSQEQNQVLSPQDINMRPVKTNFVVEYHHLHQFISDMAQNLVRSATTKLDQAAVKQLNYYNDYSVRIDHSKHHNSPLRTVFSFKGSVTIQRHSLKKSQCEYIQQRIAPEGSRVNKAVLDFPQFNPDFHFPWTLIFMQLDETMIFTQFTEEHKKSQMALPQNAELHEKQVEAKFAFNQGSRWIWVHFDPKLNMNLNERDCFIISNGFTPLQASQKDKTFMHTFIPRCKNVGASDGENCLLHGEDEAAFTRAYFRWLNVSSILQYGSFRVSILKANAFPTLKDLPEPKFYEQLIPLHCQWASLTKSQLVPHLQTKFCPCIGFGGVYLPKFAHPDHCVTGQLINMIPKFAETISDEDLDKYFTWSVTEGIWKPFTKPIQQAPNFVEYTSTQIPSEQEQLMNWNSDRDYDWQQIDFLKPLVYGSMHYWTTFNRNTGSTKISLTPASIYSPFSTGFNPFEPKVDQDPLVSLLYSHLDKLTPGQKDIQFQEFIAQQAPICTELALRYRRSNSIMGYNSAFLEWRDKVPPGQFQRQRMPNQLELLSMPLSIPAVNTFRGFDLQQFSFVPKALVSHIDEDTNSYFQHKKDCVFHKYSKYNKRYDNYGNYYSSNFYTYSTKNKFQKQ